MAKFWITLALVAFLAVVTARTQSEEWNPEEWDYYDENYDSPNLYDDDPTKVLIDKIIPVDKQADTKLADDYQIEDNRSAPTDDAENADEDTNTSEDADSAKDNQEATIAETQAILKEDDGNDFADQPVDQPAVAEGIVEETKQILDDTDNNFDDDSAKDEQGNEQKDVVDKQAKVIEETKAILEEDEGTDFSADQSNAQNPVADSIADETKQILAETDGNFDDDSAKDKQNNEQEDEAEKQADVIEETKAILNEDVGNDFSIDQSETQNPAEDSIIKETKQLLEETDNNFEAEEGLTDTETKQTVEELLNSQKVEDIDVDTIDKVYADLNEDLSKLLETWKKLHSDNDEENPDHTFDISDEKFQKMVSDVENSASNEGKNVDSEEKVQKNGDVIEDIVVGSAEEVQNEDEESKEATKNSNSESDAADDEINDEEFSDNDVSIDKVADEIEHDEEANKLLFKEDQVEQQETSTSTPKVVAETTEAVRTIDVSELTPAQYDQIMDQFIQAHTDLLDINNDDFSNIAPVHMTLSVDKNTVVTSPYFPEPYPTNNIIEWIFVGEGMGIELNITDFHVNGVNGDYLLVQPGGIDGSGTDGLVFSFRLNEPRRYRFLDVDRMFVRFVSQPGEASKMGFSFSARMISPTLKEEIPEPEPILPEPLHMMTLVFGGMRTADFLNYLEELRVLLADMATMYINANDIDPGMNTTLQITQIVGLLACNINWIGHEYCSRVVFAVPLVYEDSDETRLNSADLTAMWETYRGQDPFASRLERMGIHEFEVPDDRRATVTWALVGMSAVVMITLLGLALWRFTCLKNYSRMPEYSDHDSVYSAKQGLDLYPTPHQTLPPLYADYKWDDGKFDDTTRVDIGGFTNKNYTGDMYDMDSDDDIIVAPRTDRSSLEPGRTSYDA